MGHEEPPFLDRDRVTYHLGRELAPRLTVAPGTRARIATHDARTGRLRRPEDVLTTRPVPDSQGFPRTNPATGPIAVQGAQPGDCLCVTIESIELDAYGFVIARPEWGVVKDSVPEMTARILPVEDGCVLFDAIRIPVRPMVGVVGVAPAGEGIATLDLGRHGGNMDSNAVAVGATVHLPVQVPGGLLFLGDLHAVMGDAESTGTGCEIGGQVGVRIGLEPGRGREWPWIETATHIIAYAAAPTFEQAAELAMGELIAMVRERHGLDQADAFLLIGLAGDVRVNQACRAGIDVSVRIEFPKQF